MQKRKNEQVSLVALLLTFILPFAMVVYQLVAEVNQRIEFARSELSGVTYLHPLEQLMCDIPQARLLAHRDARQADTQMALQQQHRKIEESLAALSEVERSLGQHLNTSMLYAALQADWAKLQTAIAAGMPTDSSLQPLYNRLVADVRALISHAGDQSKLILDPDLDSYYLMDAVLLKLPESQDLLAQIRQLGEDVVNRQALTSEEKSRLIVQIGLLQANSTAIRQGTTTAFQNNPSGHLHAALDPSVQTTMAATARFLSILNDAIAQAKTVQVQPTAYDLTTYDTAAATALQSSFELWNQTAAELVGLLRARIQKYQVKTYLVEGFALLVLVTVGYVFVAFARNLGDRKRTAQRQNIQYLAARVLAEAEHLQTAIPQILQAICEGLGWNLGELWSVDTDKLALRFVAEWHVPQIEAVDSSALNRSILLEPGQGLPGRVWQQRQPLWVDDLATDPSVEQALISQLGLHSALGFPILNGDNVLGVMVFFSQTLQTPDADLLDMMAAVGSQVGQFIKTRKAEEALRQSSEMRRMALNAAQMGTWDWNILTGEETWSEDAERIFGLEPGSFKGGYEEFLSFLHPDDRAWVHQTQEHAFRTGVPYAAEYRIIWPDGSLHWVNSRGQVFWNEAGEAVRMSGVVMDITERKQTELAIAENERRLRQQSQALANLTQHHALASGDLETALQAIAVAAAETLEVERVVIWVFNSDRTEFQCFNLYEHTPNRHSKLEGLQISDYPIYFQSLSAIRTTAAHDVRTDPNFQELLEDYFLPLGVYSSLDAPIRMGGELVGIICHEHVGSPRQWTLMEQSFAASIADFASLALESYERTRTAHALRQAEEKYRSIFENSVTGIFQSTPDGRYLSANPALAKLYGYDSVDELMAQLNHIETQRYVDPKRRDEFVAQMTQHGFVAEFESQVYRRDRSIIWISERAIAIRDEQGNVVCYEGTVEDISERKQAEESLKRQLVAMEASAAGIALLNREGNYVYLNSAHAHIYGYTPEELLGQSWTVLYSDDELQRFQQEIMPQFAQTGQWRGEAVGTRKDGQRFPQEVYLTKLEDGGLVCIVQDISDRKAVEEALRHSKEAAEEANRAKSQFLANMSHELRTPLNAIIGYSDMLQEDAEDLGYGDIVPDLEKIRAAGKHLLALINDILDISKIEAGKMELYLEPFEISQLVQEVQSTLQPLIEKNHNTFTIDCPADIGTMYADLTKVRQSLFNLLSNAAKFTENGSITLTVQRFDQGMDDQMAESFLFTAGSCKDGKHSGFHLPDHTPFVLFRVTDTGIGMTLEQVQRVFQAFTQADASTTRKYGGTGLGLAISQRFCRMMGGDITVASNVGQGSTFTIWLPLQVVDPKQAVATEREAIAPTSPAVSAHGRTVLVIDDDPAVRDLVARYLTKEGFQVQTAADGEAGLRLARELRPDAITLDVLLPDRNGWSVLSSFKADPELAEIPVIVMTIVDDKSQGFALGAADYLTKPVDRKRLTKLLQRFQPTTGGSNPGRVMLVEDDAMIRLMFRRMLEQVGWAVVEAENGRVALNQLDEVQPDLILLDLMMPEVDGFQFITALRHQVKWRSLPIVVVTALDLTPADHLRLNGYVEQILQKGAYDTEELLREIHRLVVTCLHRQTAPAREETP